MSNYAVFRIIKIKDVASIGRIGKHDSRDKDNLPDNVDPARVKNNELLKGSGDNLKEFNQRTEGIKIRSNAVLGYDAVLTFTDGQDVPLDKWSKDSIKFLEKKFGKDNVRNVFLHLDEKTPHLHAFIVPVEETSQGKKLNARAFTGGTEKLRSLQDDYFDIVKQYGFDRGIVGSRAKHLSAKQFNKRFESKMKRLEGMTPSELARELATAQIKIEQLEKALNEQATHNLANDKENILHKNKISYFQEKIEMINRIDPSISPLADNEMKALRQIIAFKSTHKYLFKQAPYNSPEFKDKLPSAQMKIIGSYMEEYKKMRTENEIISSKIKRIPALDRMLKQCVPLRMAINEDNQPVINGMFRGLQNLLTAIAQNSKSNSQINIPSVSEYESYLLRTTSMDLEQVREFIKKSKESSSDMEME